MVAVFREVRRVLRVDGTLWLNLGDTYNSRLDGSHGGWNGSSPNPQRTKNDGASQKPKYAGKPKDMVGIPWRVAFALQADGWYLRSDIVWSKPNPMPESVTDRPTKAHEYVFLLTRSARYFFDQEAVREVNAPAYQGHADNARAAYNGMGRNVRSVWEIATQPYPDAHFATFPEALPERCIKAGCPIGGTVLDPFMGSGTVALVARKLGRRSIGIELSPEYAALCARRLQQLSLLADG
jgi:DNA modification methylase